MQTHVARLVINTNRRVADEADYNELAEFLQRTEPGDKPYRVRSGKSIAERISQLTGIHVRTVRRNLDSKYMQFQEAGKVDTVSTFGDESTWPTVDVPRGLVPVIRDLVDAVKEKVAENPERVDEVVE